MSLIKKVKLKVVKKVKSKVIKKFNKDGVPYYPNGVLINPQYPNGGILVECGDELATNVLGLGEVGD
jgi:hypothetical protein